MKVKIEIDTRTFVRFWLVILGFAVAAVAIYSASTALIIIGAAFFLALALNGPVSWLSKHLPGKSRILSTAVAFLMVIAVLGLFVFLVVPPIAQQTMKFVDSTPELLRSVSEQWQGLGEVVDRYNIQPQVDRAVESMQQDLGNWVAGLGKGVISSLSSAASLFAATLIVIVLTFLMLVEGPMWIKRTWSLYRNSHRLKVHKRVASRMYSVVTGYVSGQLTVAGIGALSAGAAVFVLAQFFPDLPSNLAFPTIAICFLLALIPMFGTTIAGIIVSLLLAANSWVAAVVFAIFFILYQQIENNIISPKIQSKLIELTPLAVLVAVTVGLYVFGLVGGIISIPIAGSIKVLLEEYLQNRDNGIKSSEPASAFKRVIRKLSNSDS